MKGHIFVVLVLAVLLASCTKSTEPENRAPSTPSVISPDDGATDQAINTDLWWTASQDPDGDPVTYDVHLGTSSPPALYEANVTVQRYFPGFLDYSMQYFWRIIAKDNQGNMTETAIWTFTTGQTPPTPLDFSLRADAGGDGVILTWEVMENIDAILLDIPDTAFIQLGSTDTTYADDTPTMTGDYSIYTVHGSDTSAPATVTTSPSVSTSDVTIDTTQGFGWNTSSGAGTVYLRDSTNVSSIDFYAFADTLLAEIYLYSGHHPPYNGEKTTGIMNMGGADFFTAPSAGYDSSSGIILGNYYAMNVTNDYFAKVFITAFDSVSVSFGYQFQPKRHLRIF